MKILLVQTGFLGDVILSTPVIQNLRTLYPGGFISVMTTKQSAELVAGLADEIVVFDKRGEHSGWRGLQVMAARLRTSSFDVAFSLHKSWRTAYLLWRSGIPTRYGFREASAGFLYSRTARRRDLAHDVLRNLSILRNVDLDPSKLDQTIAIRWSGEVEANVGKMLSGITRPVIGIAPGSVWETKRWTAEGFISVAKALRERGFGVVVLGGTADGDVAGRIAGEAGAVNLAGRLQLIESAAVIAKLRLLVTNDSAPLHLASAGRTPTVAIFCATVPEQGFGPWQSVSECVGIDELSCRPCRRHGGRSCPTGTNACRTGISAGMVLQAIERVLARSEAGR